MTVTYLGGGGQARHGDRDCVTHSATQQPKERQTALGIIHYILTRASAGGRCRSHRRPWTCQQNCSRHLVQGTQSGPRERSPLLKAYAGLGSAFGCLLQKSGVAQCDQAPAACATARSQRAQRLYFPQQSSSWCCSKFGLLCQASGAVLGLQSLETISTVPPLTVSSPSPVWPRTVTVTYLGGGGPARHGDRTCVNLSTPQQPKERHAVEGSIHYILSGTAASDRCRSHRCA